MRDVEVQDQVAESRGRDRAAWGAGLRCCWRLDQSRGLSSRCPRGSEYNAVVMLSDQTCSAFDLVGQAVSVAGFLDGWLGRSRQQRWVMHTYADVKVELLTDAACCCSTQAA